MDNQYILICEDISDDLLYLSLKILSKSKQIEDFSEIVSFEEEIQILKESIKKLDKLNR